MVVNSIPALTFYEFVVLSNHLLHLQQTSEWTTPWRTSVVHALILAASGLPALLALYWLIRSRQVWDIIRCFAALSQTAAGFMAIVTDNRFFPAYQLAAASGLVIVVATFTHNGTTRLDRLAHYVSVISGAMLAVLLWGYDKNISYHYWWMFAAVTLLSVSFCWLLNRLWPARAKSRGRRRKA
jgi:hypothetical protein